MLLPCVYGKILNPDQPCLRLLFHDFISVIFPFENVAPGVKTFCFMSYDQVLRVLEGGDAAIPLFLDLNTVGSRSGHMHGLSLQTQPELRIDHSRRLSH